MLDFFKMSWKPTFKKVVIDKNLLHTTFT